MQKYYKRLLILIVSLLLILCFAFIKCNDKKSIQTATYKDLEQLQDIGDKLARGIIIYTKENKITKVDQLDDMKYIGEKRLKELKKYYK